jgi:AcrR family transcriptional regulator
MYHYHFKSKKRFTRAVLQSLYEDFFARLSLASRGEGTSLEQLRGSLLVVGRFVRDHRELVGALWKDILNSDREVLQFIRNNVPRHAAVIRRLLLKCKKDGSLPPVPFAQVIGYAMGGLNVPTLVAGHLRQAALLPESGARLVLSDQAIEQRVDMILAGLKGWKA